MWIAAVLSSLCLLGLRLDLARVLGLGDAEALFLAYGLHPQPAYLDHPGLIGWLARGLGPSAPPAVIHVWTALAASALPWLGVLSARACGASSAAALRTFFALALLPELCLRSSAFTPEVPFAFFWLASLACAGWALRSPPGSFRSLLATLGAAVAAALCCLSKSAGWLLVLSLVWLWLSPGLAERRRTLAPWAAALVLGILVSPLLGWWRERGLGLQWDPVSPAGALALLLRPLVGATPPFLIAGGLVAADLLTTSRRPAIDRLLRLLVLVPLLPLLLLALGAGGDEQWLTPAYLTLAVQLARCESLPRRLMQSCAALGAALALLGWAWLRTDLAFAGTQLLGIEAPVWDSSSELFAWGPARPLLASVVEGARERTGHAPLVVGPHWGLCAQAEIALEGRVAVGCDSAQLDDYDFWAPIARWPDAETIILVTDSRFVEAAPDTLYGRPLVAVHDAEVKRHGRVVGHVLIAEFDRDEANAGLQGEDAPAGPAAVGSARAVAEGLGPARPHRLQDAAMRGRVGLPAPQTLER